MLSEFHDDLFASPKVKDESHFADYQPKNCTDEWYLSDEQNIGEAGIQNLKFRADRAYSVANYQLALSTYRQILDRQWPPQMQRDLTEAIIRCQLHLGRLSESLSLAIEMNIASKNIDHKTCSMMLLARVYHHTKDNSNEMLTYAGLIQFHPLNIHYWVQFTEAFATHWEISCVEPYSVSEEKHSISASSDSENSLLAGLTPNVIFHIIGACFVRVLAIYESFSRHSQTSSLIKRSELEVKAKKWLDVLPLVKDFQQAAFQNLCRDILGERDEVEENEDLRTIATIPDNLTGAGNEHLNLDQRLFYTAWFGWIRAHLEMSRPEQHDHASEGQSVRRVSAV